MSSGQLDDLLGDLSNEGAIESSGVFGLNRDKAREKMQKFQLTDPHNYVLEFVHAAHLLGATRIDFAIDADEMEVRFDGATLDGEQLRDVYSAAFARRTDPVQRAMRHIAIGLNAAQALDPALIRIECAREDGAIVMELRPGQEDVFETDITAEQAGTRIYLRESWRAGHMLEFFRNLRGNLAEKVALRERCRFAEMPIYLDGAQVSSGLHLPDEVVWSHQFRTEHELGAIGIVPDQERSEITLMQHGVIVDVHHMPSALMRAHVVVDSDRLTKNLSQSAFVEDEAWHRLMQHILRYELQAAITGWLEESLTPDGEDFVPHPRLHDFLKTLITSLIDDVLPRTHDQLDQLHEDTRALLETVARYRCWKLAHPRKDQPEGEAAPEYSMRQILEMSSSGQLRWSSVSIDVSTVPTYMTIFFFRNARHATRLATYLGLEAQKSISAIKRAQTYHDNRERWSRNPRRALPPSTQDDSVITSYTKRDGIAVLWRVPKGARLPSFRLRVIYKERLMWADIHESELFNGMEVEITSEHFEPDLSFERPKLRPGLIDALLMAVEQFEVLIKKCARVPRHAP